MMSWVISTCMACTGVELASLDPMSPSGAPTRAMPPGGNCVLAMISALATFPEKRRNEVFTRTRMSLMRTMHGDSTQARSREQAVQTGGGRGPSQELLVVGQALVGLRAMEE